MYIPRSYRRRMENGRFCFFEVIVEETDLWIGMSQCPDHAAVREEVYNWVLSIRKKILRQISIDPSFIDSHEPIPIHSGDDEIIKEMKNAGNKAGTGPMAAVAGLIAMKVLYFLDEKYAVDELIIENGGDIFLKIKNKMILSPFAENNRRFDHLGFKISAEYTYLAVCGSSGMFGHSFSYGKADLVVCFSEDACLADAWATSLANKILDKKDVGTITKRSLPEGLTGILAVKEDEMGYRGPFQIVRV